MKKFVIIAILGSLISLVGTASAANPSLSWSVNHGVAGDIARAITYNQATGKIYVIGKNTSGNGRFKVIRLVSNNGALDGSWGSGGVVYYDSSVSYQDEGEGIVTDSAGNVYVTGMSFNPTTGNDFRTIKFNSAGTILWNNVVNVADTWDWAYDLALSNDQNQLYVVGQNGIVRYNTSDGSNTTLLSSVSVGLESVAVDSGNNIIARFWGGGTIRKYNSSGTQLWSSSDGSCSGTAGKSLALSPSGNAYIPFRISTACVYLGKFNTDGLNVFQAGALLSPLATVAYDLTTDSYSFVYLAGQKSGGINVIIKKDQAAQNVWSPDVTLPFQPSAVVVASSTGDIYATGGTFQVVRYTQSDYGATPTSPSVSWGETISGGGAVKRDHVTELRTWVDSRRASVGLGGFTWTDQTLNVGGGVKAIHITDLRNAITAVYNQCGVSLPLSWTNNPLTSGTVIRADHFNEIRTVVNSAPLCGPRKVFLTSLTYNGNLGGVSGADALCQARATAAGLSGNYKAWIATSNSNAPGFRFTSSSFTFSYQLVNGTPIGSSFEDLTDGKLATLINRDENGNLISTTLNAWTNVNPGGVRASSGNHCSSWSNSGSSFGASGNVATTSFKWTEDSASTVTCSNQRRLYCVEQ